jgi:glycosyltransferase involved in cell wall biosynthesis
VTGRGLKSVTHGAGTGYGDAACAYLAGLDNLGIPVSWQPVDSSPDVRGTPEQFMPNVPEAIRPTLNGLWQRAIDYDTVLLNLPPLRWYHHYLERESRHALFCYATWELERLPASWAPVLNRFDGVVVPSQFNALTFKSSGVTAPISIVPHVTRVPQPAAVQPAWMTQMQGLYVFYTIGTWSMRKALEELVRVYLSTFTARDDVCLVIKTDALDYMRYAFDRKNGKTDQRSAVWYTLAKILADYPDLARIHLVTERLTPGEIDALHARADCYVSLTHSEGWGLGAFDALQFGKPVIMPGYGGQLEYLGAGYPLLVRHTLRRVGTFPQDGYFSGMEDQYWAEACTVHAAELLRAVYDDPAAAVQLGRDMQAAIRAQFSPARICPNLATALGFR